jgi:hypothetical protein
MLVMSAKLGLVEDPPPETLATLLSGLDASGETLRFTAIAG